LCSYVPRSQVNDNHYFGLRTVLYKGGDYKFWFPPSKNLTDVANSTAA
jgi:hypothetical protein